MQRFQTTDEITTRNIWVSRINADDANWGSEDALIRRALDANHNYRKGLSRLPFTAYVFDQSADRLQQSGHGSACHACGECAHG